MTIKSIGAPAAERDDFLSTCFVDNHILDSVRAGECFILLGNRGAGKSAIFERFKDTATGIQVASIAPEDYSYEMVSSQLSSTDLSSWAKQSNFTAAWKHALLTAALRIVRDNAENTRSSHYREVYAYLRNSNRIDRLDLLDELVSYIHRFKSVNILGSGGDLHEPSAGQLYRLEHLMAIVPAFKELVKEVPVTILVDELDRGWDASDQAKFFVAGLFQASIWLNQISPNFRVLIALRRELYDNIPAIFEDAQKFRDVLRYVEWDEYSLKQVAARRLREAFDLADGLSVDTQWSSVFSEILDYRKTDSFNYVVDRTLYRPREIILFINDCLEKAAGKSDPIDYKIISAAEIKYSSDRMQDIAAEYRFQYPELLKLFNAFRGLVYRLTREGLIHIIETTKGQSFAGLDWLESYTNSEVIGILYEIGFLKALAVGGDKGKARSGSKWVGFYQSPHVDLSKIDMFQVHPMFRVALSMKEK